ncbi:MAG TPA: 12-oxophytodienoate reductase [Gammaproteobacteria bacterium]
MTVGVDALFAPFEIKNLRLKNRFVMSPMSRYASPGCRPNRELADYYRRRAEADVALILTGGAAVDRPAANNSTRLADFRPVCYPGWARCVAAVHEAGGLIGVQLWHAGGWFRTEPDYRPAPLESPSGLGAPGLRVGEPMSEECGAEIIAAFAKAAAAAKRIGFDWIELHAAHGYLLDQFFWAETNRRTDRWGGANLADRLGFVTSVIEAVRGAVGPEMVLSIRISQWKEQDYNARLARTPDELRSWVEPLAEAGIDVFNCSQRRFWEPEFPKSRLNFAGWVKKLSNRPTITCGSVGLDNDVTTFFRGKPARPAALDALVERFDAGEFDLVAVGRALLADPRWVTKVRDGTYEHIRPFDKSKADVVY